MTPRLELFSQVCVAAELPLHGALPSLLEGTARLRDPQYATSQLIFGGRTLADGAIDGALGRLRAQSLARPWRLPIPGAYARSGAGLPASVASAHSNSPPRARYPLAPTSVCRVRVAGAVSGTGIAAASSSSGTMSFVDPQAFSLGAWWSEARRWQRRAALIIQDRRTSHDYQVLILG